MGRLSKDCPHQCGWASSNPLRAWIKKVGERYICSLLMPGHPFSPVPQHWHPWFSGLWVQTGTTLSAFWASSLQSEDCGTSQPLSKYMCLSLIISLFVNIYICINLFIHLLLVLFLWKTPTNTLPKKNFEATMKMSNPPLARFGANMGEGVGGAVCSTVIQETVLIRTLSSSTYDFPDHPGCQYFASRWKKTACRLSFQLVSTQPDCHI